MPRSKWSVGLDADLETATATDKDAMIRALTREVRALRNELHQLGGIAPPPDRMKELRRTATPKFLVGKGEWIDGGEAKGIRDALLVADPYLCGTYFVGHSGTVKIGHSGSIKHRVYSLIMQSPVPLELLAVIPSVSVADAKHVESMAHREFINHRTHGEWFKVPIDLLHPFVSARQGIWRPRL